MATYQTLKETSDQDLSVENGDLVFVEDEDYVIQQLQTNYRFTRDDWFLNLDEGIRYIDNEDGIIGSRVLSDENRNDLILTASNTTGVRELSDIKFEPGSDGTLTVTVITITEFAPEGVKSVVII